MLEGMGDIITSMVHITILQSRSVDSIQSTMSFVFNTRSTINTTSPPQFQFPLIPALNLTGHSVLRVVSMHEMVSIVYYYCHRSVVPSSSVIAIPSNSIAANSPLIQR